ncbi:MAG: putative terminase large subunit [Prokaryotic dsDNA virus sp.]|nr:MAG: putative terminase large subunit [Prokaryotic dsDNA virus sp.]|tara:strand:+ start:532 stop:2097 length:1566 start_codon:yes stop_codon:yes gene_type:complete
MSNINLHNVSKEEEALQMAKHDLISFGKLFLPDDFRRSETPFFHYQVADACNDLNTRQLAVILPRGHGKTVLTKCNIMHDFLFTKEPLFYGWVAASSKISVPNLDYIKYHLEFNEKVLYYFGNLKGKKWTEDDIELKNGAKLISKSNLSGIRGGAKLHKRYDLIVLDDFEDENNTITPESRAKISNLVTAVVFPALEPGSGRLRINGTPVHFDSFINNILIGHDKAKSQGIEKDFSWKVITYKAIQDDGTPLWPGWFGEKEMARKKKFYADSGQPQKFYQEYMMEVQNEEDSIFNRNHIKYWEGDFKYDEDEGVSYIYEKNTGDLKPVNVFSGVDPATDSARRDSDFSVIITVGVDSDNNIYVLDYLRMRGLPVLGIPGTSKKGIVDYMFEKNSIYHSSLFVVEDTTMSKPVLQALMAEMRRRNDFSVKYCAEKPGNRMSKRDRIQEILAQRFAVGAMHIKKDMYDLQREIITFGPRMGHDDTIDALAYACKFAYPLKGVSEDKEGKWKKHKPKAKSWVTA